MKKGSTLFLKLAIFLIGIGVLALMTTFTISVVSDSGGLFLPILIIIYATALPFFFTLHQTLKILSYIDKDIAFSKLSIQALRNIKYSAIAISVLYIAGLPFIFYVADKDDAPGVVVLGLIIVFASIVIATFTAVLQKLVQSGLDMKLENDLTV